MKELSITELIKQAINDTAVRFRNDNIVTVEDMIPHMRTRLKAGKYPKKYRENIQYDESPDAVFDIYYPEDCPYTINENGTDNGTENNMPENNAAGSDSKPVYPVFIEIHGGAWYFGQKSSIEFAPFLQGIKRGFACISLGYTLAPKAVYPKPVIELKKAIAYIKSHADELHINPDKIVLWGGSAGAHLASLAAYSHDTGYLYRESGQADSSVNMLVLWYGCYNLFAGKRLDDWIYKNFFGTDDLAAATESIILSNPGCHVTENAPYTILQHGLMDGVVPYEQSVYLYNTIKTVAEEDRCRLYLNAGCDHADVKLFAIDNVNKMFNDIEEYFSKI